MHALRFYERVGLLASAVQRTPDGRRTYHEQANGTTDSIWTAPAGTRAR